MKQYQNSEFSSTSFSFLCILFILLPTSWLGGQSEGAYVIDAPPDAWEAGSAYPYYGSENPWNRRMFSEKATSWQYKRRGQRQILHIIEGEPEMGLDLATFRLSQTPGDPESLFIQTVAYAQLGKTDQALETLLFSLDQGLPFERYLAGPRDLLEPLYQTETFRRMREEQGSGLIHGPTLGAMTSTSVTIWVRTVNESQVTVEARRQGEEGGPRSQTTFSTRADQDFTGTGVLRGLEPNTRYTYMLKVDGKPVASALPLDFRTYPESGEAGSYSIAFGGCAGYTPWNERIWDKILEFNPQALLLLGDNVYLDIPDHPGAFHQYTMYRRQSRPEFRRLMSATPVYAIWDDHDAAMDDVWLGPHRDRPSWKMPTLEFFQQNWPNPSFGSEEYPAVWHSFSVGDVDFFMLDGRFYRTHPFEESATMLGPDQLAWLKQSLEESTATFKVIVSPVNWVIGSKEGSRDTWQGFARERNDLFDFLTREDIDGVFLLSSDRHRADIWKIEREGDYPLWEFSNGQLTNLHTHDTVPEAEFSYNEKNMFGLLRFQTDIEDPWVAYEIITIEGEVIHTHLVRRSDMQ